MKNKLILTIITLMILSITIYSATALNIPIENSMLFYANTNNLIKPMTLNSIELDNITTQVCLNEEQTILVPQIDKGGKILPPKPQQQMVKVQCIKGYTEYETNIQKAIVNIYLTNKVQAYRLQTLRSVRFGSGAKASTDAISVNLTRKY
jgi:hypothetical protein